MNLKHIVRNQKLMRDKTALQVYMAILGSANENGVKIITRSTLAKYLGIHQSALYRALQRLVVRFHVISIKSNKLHTEITLVSWDKPNAVHKTANKSANNVQNNKERIEEREKESIKEKEKEDKKENSVLIARARETKEILAFYNLTHGTKYRSVDQILPNVSYWRQTYTVEEIKQAIANIPNHTFWTADKMTPVVFFRRMNTAKQPVDYIGEMLHTKKPDLGQRWFPTA